MLNAIFSQELNTQSKTVNNAVITLGDTDDTGKGRKFKSRFIQPGIAGYPGQFGNVLITKETLDKFIKTMAGAPVIINHKNLTVKNVDKNRVGVVSNVWYDNKDGWYWCDGVIWDKTAQNLIADKGWSVSCSYDVTLVDDEGGSENNIPYDIEFLDGVFTHLAIVNNPRYERANIVLNSKTAIYNGGSGSGNYNHTGRPGQVGGSATNNTDKENFNREIDKIKAGEYPRSKQITVSTKPSKPWLDAGLKDAKIVLPVAVYLKATKEKHNVDEETIRNFPELLKDPPFIFKSSTEQSSFVAVLDAIEKDEEQEKPLIVAVKPVGDRVEVNIITSTYGKDDDFIKRETTKGNLLYKRKKTISNSIVASIATETLKPFTNIITDNTEDFNPNVTNYEQKRKKDTIYNGGSGSGNHNHSGRPGQVGGSAANQPQNVDLSTLEPVEFTQEDIERFKEPGSVKEYYKNYIQGTSVKHPELGDIYFVAKGLNETISKNRHNDLHIVTKIPELIEKAKYDRLEDLKHLRADNICKFHILYAKANTGNKSKTVLIKVAEDTSGNKFFILKPIQTIKNSFEELSQLPPEGSQGFLETIYIINDISEDINPYVTNYEQKRKKEMEVLNAKILNSLGDIINRYARGEIEKSKYDLKILEGLRKIINECGL